MKLDPNDSRPPYLQVAQALRAAILTRKIMPGNRLPSGRELAQEYGVARMTINRALQVLHYENLIVSRPGSGIYVREQVERPAGLRPHIEGAFQDSNVSIDFVGLTGETLQGAIQEPLDKIRHGLLAPEAISIRLLLPDTSVPWVLPCNADTLKDDPEFRKRIENITNRHLGIISDSLEWLLRIGLIKESKFEARSHQLAPLFKLYILNKKESFFGFYQMQRQEITINGESHPVFDLWGQDALLFHHAITKDENSNESQYVSQAQTWFEGVWNHLSKERKLN